MKIHILLIFVYFVDQFDKKPNYSTMKEKSLTALAINCSKSKILSKNQIENFEKENLIINYGTLPEEWLGIPLKIEDRTIGIMVTQSYSDLFFTEEDVDFLEYVSEQIAISIKRKKYEEEIFNSNQSYFKLFNESPTAYIDLSYIKLIRYLEQNQIEFDAASLEDELFNNSNKFKKLFELIEINQINKQLLELFCVKNKKELLENFSNSTNLKSILKVINNIIKNTNLEDVCEFYDFQNNQKYLSV